ncbi:MAG: 2-oxoacid:ferredoxin oxidoreductase subunit beta, partial [Bacteroidales bacterium]
SARHKGMSVVEILQNCVIFNNGAHKHLNDRENKADRQLWLEHGKRMLFGKEGNKGLILKGTNLQVVTIGEDGISEADILIHDAHSTNPIIHLQLIRMRYPEFPVAFGVIRDVEKPSYEQLMVEQIKEVQKKSPYLTADALFRSGTTWEVE